MPAEQTSCFTEAELQVFSERLADYSARLAGAAERMKEGKASELWVFRRASLEKALDRLSSFDAELQRAVEADRLGHPLGPDSSKTRTAKKTAKKTRKIPRNAR